MEQIKLTYTGCSKKTDVMGQQRCLGFPQAKREDFHLCHVPQSANLHEEWLPVDLGFLASQCDVM